MLILENDAIVAAAAGPVKAFAANANGSLYWWGAKTYKTRFDHVYG